jgi:hypothetical protein
MHARIDSTSARAYHEVYDGADDEGPVAAEVGVGDVGAEQRREEDDAGPVGDVVGRLHRALVELVRHVDHQVRRDAVVRHPLEQLVHCITGTVRFSAQLGSRKKGKRIKREHKNGLVRAYVPTMKAQAVQPPRLDRSTGLPRRSTEPSCAYSDAPCSAAFSMAGTPRELAS